MKLYSVFSFSVVYLKSLSCSLKCISEGDYLHKPIMKVLNPNWNKMNVQNVFGSTLSCIFPASSSSLTQFSTPAYSKGNHIIYFFIIWMEDLIWCFSGCISSFPAALFKTSFVYVPLLLARMIIFVNKLFDSWEKILSIKISKAVSKAHFIADLFFSTLTLTHSLTRIYI